MSTVVKDLGAVTAYAYAVEQGYQGTEEEFAELMARQATVAEEAAASADAAAASEQNAAASEQNAAASATAASGSAATASTKATEAESSASSAASSAATASAKATEAASSATAAANSASSAASAASQAASSATAAESSATGASTAKTAAQAAQTAAETAQAAAEAAAEQAEETLDSYAKTDGSYETMTVGNAEQLVATVGVEDGTPYNFRTSGGSVDIGDRETVNAIVGGTVVWNEKLRNNNFVDTTSWAKGSNDTFTVANGVATFRASAIYHNLVQALSNPIGGHVYLGYADVQSYKSTNVFFYMRNVLGGSVVQSVTRTLPTTKSMVSNAIKLNQSGSQLQFMYQDNNSSDFGDIIIQNVNLIDLTQMFGSTIADYIYSLEQANAGAGVAFFRKLFPKPYYEYNAGELMSVKTNLHKMVGFNALSEITNGAEATQYTIALYGKADLLPNTTYCLSFVGASGHYLYPNENLFTSSARITLTGNRQYILLTTLDYVRKTISGQYDANAGWKLLENGTGNTVAPNFTDVCLNLSWSGYRDGEYEPYKEWVYPLDSSLTLRGIPKLDASNNLYYDGDTYAPDGTVTRRYGIVTYDGSNDEAWSHPGGTNRFYITVNDIKGTVNDSTVANIVSDRKYVTKQYAVGPTDAPCITGRAAATASQINLFDNDYQDLAAFRSFLSANPITIVYELATPTTETAEPYTQIQTVDDFGTEAYTDAAYEAGARDVEIPVGSNTFYPANLRDKLQHLPDLASADGYYMIQQTNNDMSLVLFRIPQASGLADGTYTLKATVASGTPTYTWVSDTVESEG